MPSRSLDRGSSLAAPLFAALVAFAPVRSARADEPAAPPAPTATIAPSASAPAASAPAAPEKEASPALPDDLPAPGTARPPPLESPEPRPLPWDRLLDVGGDFVLVARPTSFDVKGHTSAIRYEPATGFGFHIRWPVLSHLTIEGYYVDVHMPVDIPRGALGVSDPITTPPVETFVVGARLSPSMQWGRVRAWLTAGAGWGRLEFQRMTATGPTGTYAIRERGASFLEFPFGLGVSFEIVKRWLSVDLVGTASFVAAQHGDAFDESQTVDSAGHLHTVGRFPVMDASLVQTIGLSLLL